MTQAEMLQFEIMENFWGRLMSLTDAELATRKQAEMEMQGNVKEINKEMERRNRDE